MINLVGPAHATVTADIGGIWINYCRQRTDGITDGGNRNGVGISQIDIGEIDGAGVGGIGDDNTAVAHREHPEPIDTGVAGCGWKAKDQGLIAGLGQLKLVTVRVLSIPACTSWNTA